MSRLAAQRGERSYSAKSQRLSTAVHCKERGVPCRASGFTLIEMVIVLLVISILAVVAQAKFASSLSFHQATGLARQIAKNIDSVCQTARATSTSKSIAFNVAAKTYTLVGVINPDRRSAIYTVSLTSNVANATFGTVNLGGDAVLNFNGFGLPDSGGAIQVMVGGVTKTVTVDINTGRTTVS